MVVKYRTIAMNSIYNSSGWDRSLNFTVFFTLKVVNIVQVYKKAVKYKSSIAQDCM